MILDPLTGAYSQALLDEQLRKEVERAVKQNRALSLLLLDLDHFKSINDSFGHARGDETLREFAERIRAAKREKDFLFRYGGDEFVLILPDTPKHKACRMAERLVSEVGSARFDGDPPLSLTVSIGVATLPDDAQNAEDLFEEADLRLYEAKRRGRAQAVAETPASDLTLPFDEVSRLVERDEALQTVQGFFKKLKDHKRGLLSVTGPRGSGRSRFLAEVGKTAQLQGYEAVSIHCSTAAKSRQGFALAEALKARGNSVSTPITRERLTQSLQRLATEKSTACLFFAIDNITEFDWASLDVLRRFLSSADILRLAVAYTVDPESSRRVFLQAPLWDQVKLESFSEDGVKVWLRSLLHWEPTADLTAWLYKKTKGLPAFLKKGVSYFLRRGILMKEDGGWVITRDLTDIPLAEKIGVGRKSPPHNLPLALTNFVGRAREIEETKALIAGNRLVTVLGPGGIGKTRLSIQAAAELAEDFPDGVRFVPLASLRSRDLLILAIADSFEFSFYGTQEPGLQLINYLREKESLVVLDSFEHLVEAADLISQILHEAPQLRLLVTSRERLAIQGEVILELSGMDFPSEDVSGDIETYSAVQLFIEGARRLDPGLVISKKDQPFLARISRMVEGIPLGIELAASWVRSLPLSEIAKEIEQGYDFLATSLRDVPERHRSLKLVFDYSWELLGNKERDVFRRLSVFRGGFSRQAAERIAGASLALLSLLIDKSLITKDVAGHYQMLEVLRRYAEERLSEDEEVYKRTKDLHAAYQGEALHQREQELTGARQKQALEEIKEEIENVRAGFRWAVARRNMEIIETYLESLPLFYEYQGRFAEAKELFTWAAEQLQGTEGLVPARVLALEGTFTYRLGAYKEGRTLLQKSLSVFRELGAKKEIAAVFNSLGSISFRKGEYEKSRKLITESLAIGREIGDEVRIGTALSGLASVATNLGEYEEARTMSEESLQVHRKMSNYRGMARTLNNLGNALLAMGSYDEANRCYAESLAIYTELGHKWGMEIVLGNMSEAALYKEEYSKARQLLSETLTICREVGDQEGIIFSLNHMGKVSLALVEYGDARRFYEQGLEISKGIDDPGGKTSSLNGLGMLARELGEHEKAADYFRDALKIATQMKRINVAVDILFEVAKLLARKGEDNRALELLAVVIENLGAEKETRDKAEKLLAELESKLPAEEFEAAYHKGKARKFDEVVKGILKEG